MRASLRSGKECGVHEWSVGCTAMDGAGRCPHVVPAHAWSTGLDARLFYAHRAAQACQPCRRALRRDGQPLRRNKQTGGRVTGALRCGENTHGAATSHRRNTSPKALVCRSPHQCHPVTLFECGGCGIALGGPCQRRVLKGSAGIPYEQPRQRATGAARHFAHSARERQAGRPACP